jgi:hypothetical protein
MLLLLYRHILPIKKRAKKTWSKLHCGGAAWMRDGGSDGDA